MFFDPDDYLERDPATAADEVEAARLAREAGQRAALCETMARLVAQDGFEAVSAKRVFVAAALGSFTFYKLFEDREACLLEAFERCAEAILRRVEEAVASAKDPAAKARSGLGSLVEILGAKPHVARLVLVEIRVGGPPCREAQQRWLERLTGVLEEACRADAPRGEDRTARMVVDALAFLLGQRVAESSTPALRQMLPELVYVALAPYLGAASAATRAEQDLAAARLPRSAST